MVEASPASSRPRMFGREPTGRPLSWAWAEQRLREARTYWVATVTGSGRPHVRPYWGCWRTDTFLFSTMSRALSNVRRNPAASVHLESGTDVVVVEGRADVVLDHQDLRSFVEDYNRKYGWDLEVRGRTVADDAGASGNVVAVRALVIFGWERSPETATKWDLSGPF